MALVGDILYPSNKHMAEEIDSKQNELGQLIDLHNDLVNSYDNLRPKVMAFNAYMMHLAGLEYQLAFDKEHLDNLPADPMPKLADSIADTIEQYTFDALNVKLVYSGVKALYNGVANVVRMGRTLTRASAGGTVNMTKFASELGPELDQLRAC